MRKEEIQKNIPPGFKIWKAFTDGRPNYYYVLATRKGAKKITLLIFDRNEKLPTDIVSYEEIPLEN